jgi:hypothetical protein
LAKYTTEELSDMDEEFIKNEITVLEDKLQQVWLLASIVLVRSLVIDTQLNLLLSRHYLHRVKAVTVCVIIIP